MADTDKDQKTHDPTEKKLQDARDRGEIAMSPEVRHAVMFVGMLIALGSMGVWTMNSLVRLLVGLWGGAGDHPLDAGNAFLRKDRKQHQHRADAREQDQECGGFDRQGIHGSAP